MFEPNYEGSPIVWGPPGSSCSAVGAHSFMARAGHHLAPQPLSSGCNVFEELGPGFTLLGLDADDAALAAFAIAAERLRAPLKIVRDSRAGGRERYHATFVLVRPDQFVAWAADLASGDATEILARSVGV